MSAFFRRNGIQLNGKIPIFAHLLRGEMPEWSIGPHSKCGVRATVPGVRIPLSPLTTLIIKVLQVRHPKRNPFLRPFWVLSFLSPLKQFAEEADYGRKYLRLPKKEKDNHQ